MYVQATRAGLANVGVAFQTATATPLAQARVAARPTVKIDINNTADTSDDITVLQPAQTIPARVTLDGASGIVHVSVPSGRASIDPPDLTLTTGTPAIVTITPLQQSQAVNDVQIIATFNAAQAGQARMTIVSIAFSSQSASDPQTFNVAGIRNPNTPTGMPNRIPPRVTTPIQATLGPDLSGSNQKVTLATLNTSAANGNFTINGGSTLDIIKTTTVNLSGTVQTTATAPTQSLPNGGGNASKLMLVAMVRGQNAVQTTGFSVAAIPLNYTDTFNHTYTTAAPIILSLPDGPPFIGVEVIDGWSSDSETNGSIADLDQVQIQEQVERPSGGLTGAFTQVVPDLGQSPYSPANEASGDRHLVPAFWLSGVGTPPGIQIGVAKMIVNQTHVFRDFRTGAINIPMPNSGFVITQEITADSSLVLHLTTSKVGAAVTANGVSSGPGNANITVVQP